MTWNIVIAAALVLLHQAGGFRRGTACSRPPQRDRGACLYVGGAALLYRCIVRVGQGRPCRY